MSATQTSTVPAVTLPALDMPCPHCTPEDARKQMTADYNAWSDEETAAYEKFSASYQGWSVTEAWESSPVYQELNLRKPELSGDGCVECDYKKRVLTDAGRQVLDFVREWAGK
ncbi:hypothetical protein [Micromonospora carbonacea]|uniref:hypothetical protein n=1 Tax=Micromonospora carbonacea TaxID=47853 RepID=UPI00371670E3